MAKLHSIYEKYEDPKWLNSVRAFRNRAIRESNRRRPLTGAYYWIPRPERRNTYELVTFSDQEFGDTSHYRLWRRFILPMISQIWEIDVLTLRRNLGDCYTALPRGRVIKDEKGYKIIHGNNYTNRGWQNKILREFNIHGQSQFVSDPYEVILLDDLNRLQRLTNRQFGLVGVDPTEAITYGDTPIKEASATIINDLNQRIQVLIDPSPRAVVRLLDSFKGVLGGWLSEFGVAIWKRDQIDHNTAAKGLKINRRKSIAFYLTASDYGYDEDGQKVITDISAETSEFSGRDNFDGLMSSEFMQGIMKIIALRKEQMQDDFSVDDLMSDLSYSDY